MHKSLILIVATSALLSVSGCGTLNDRGEHFDGFESELVPPPPPEDGVFYEPRPGYVWGEGRWVRPETWEWRGGGWIGRRPGYVYQQGYWGREDDS
jgi:hypothetical protein